jgi:Nuclease-related domain
MARMHPEEIEELENPTEGERRVFRFLREAARPDSEFIGWYEPAIGEQGIEPDFVLLGNHHGLLVLEVKDWRIDQIEEADSLNFKIWIGGKEENRTNPDRQVTQVTKRERYRLYAALDILLTIEAPPKEK